MNDLDLTWLGFGLFMLACGLVPAAMAWADARRGTARPVAPLFHERVRTVVLAGPAWVATVSRPAA